MTVFGYEPTEKMVLGSEGYAWCACPRAFICLDGGCDQQQQQQKTIKIRKTTIKKTEREVSATSRHCEKNG